ncbi:lasso peptide biosynthesis B2 protein [Saccharopolyspora taberi]|uniref:Microcin J25-processing protein McjB C-terminal domain-containing protein n=1 Tax=Saccharopolyspora taberi TaxID=60895 RepID=A0ABN3VB85_9PSEU
MSIPVTLDSRDRLPLHRRGLPLVAVTIARLLAHTRPARIRRVLEFARRGATPASADQALAARRAVVAVSLRCAGQGCLQRSIATALLCRARGSWPTWCTGVRTQPFAAHAWVEADDQLIGEPFPKGHYTPLLTIPPLRRHGDPDPSSDR